MLAASPPADATNAHAAAAATGRQIQPSGTANATAVHASLGRKSPHAAPKPAPHHNLSKNAATLAAAKAVAAKKAAGAGTAAPTTTAPSVKFSGLTGGGLTDPYDSPSDSTGDVSPSNYIQMVNSQIAVYDRNLGLIAQATLAGFGGAGGTLQPAQGDCVFDPQIAWDPQAGRWIYSMLDQTATTSCASPTGDYLDFGYSLTGDPLAGWCGFYLGLGSDLPDYDKLGHDDHFFVIGANLFGNYGDETQFKGAVIYTFAKPAPGSTTCPQQLPATIFGGTLGQAGSLTNADTTPAETPVPVDTTDSSPVGYIVSAEDPLNSTAASLTVWHVAPSPGAPSTASLFQDASVTVPAYSVPPPVPQPNMPFPNTCATYGACLDSLDARLTEAVGHYDPSAGRETIWTQHAVADSSIGSLSVERWYEISPGATTPRQTGTVSNSTLYVFNGAISPTTAGNEAVIFYNTAGTSQAADYRAQRRTSTTPLGTTGDEVVIAASTASDVDFTCGFVQNPVTTAPCRWGDYAAARPDPSNANSVWGTGMLVNGFGGGPTQSGWTTEIARMTPGCLSASLSANPRATLGQSVVVTASSTDCSNPLYEFWLRNANGSWSMMQPFSVLNSWTWNTAGYAAGTYPIVVWVTEAGDTQTTWDVYAQANVSLGTSPPCASVVLSGAPAGPVDAGTALVLSAGATGCAAPVYQFWIQPPGGTWAISRQFAAGSAWTWSTTNLVPGTYHVAVWANESGDSLATYESVDVKAVTLTGCGSVVATPTPTSPQTPGPAVSIAAVASGCSAPLYQFWMLAPGSSTWQKVQAYSPVAAYSFATANKALGLYRFVVWARQDGSAGISSNSLGRWDAFTSFTYSLVPPSCASVGAVATPASPQASGASITISATAGGCTDANPLYQFWMLAPGGTWQIVKPYSTTASIPWDTTRALAGTYTFSVWVRDAASNGLNSSSLGRWDAFTPLSYTLTATPCSSVSASQSTSGSTVTVAAQAVGCANPLYQFWMLAPGSSTWVKVQPYGQAASYAFVETGKGSGTYQFSIWVRDSSSPGTSGNSLGRWDAYTPTSVVLP